mgnify:FL=1
MQSSTGEQFAGYHAIGRLMGLDSINVKALATCSYTFRASILVSTNIRLPSLNQDSMSISTKHTFSAYDSQHYFHGDVT